MSGFDLGALLAGLVFAGAGTLFLLDELGILVVEGRLLVPGLLIALGVAAVAGALDRGSRDA